MASELAPQESLRPKERPNTPEFLAQIERYKLESEIGRERLRSDFSEPRKIPTMFGGALSDFPSHYVTSVNFSPRNHVQYNPESISSEKIEYLKSERTYLSDSLDSLLKNGDQKFSQEPSVAPAIYGETSAYDADGFLGIFVQSTGERSLYHEIQVFNYQTALLPDEIGISPIDISPERLGTEINNNYEEEGKKLPELTLEGFLIMYHDGENVPLPHTPDYIETCSRILSWPIDSIYRKYITSQQVLETLPQDIRSHVDYDIVGMIQKIDTVRKECLGVLLQDNGEGGYVGIEFDGQVSEHEIRIAQYGVESFGVIESFNEALSQIPKEMYNNWGEISGVNIEKLKSEGGNELLSFLLGHPRGRVRTATRDLIQRYNLELGLRGSIDGIFGDHTHLMIAIYQYQKQFESTGFLNKETMLALAKDAKNSL